MNDFTTYKIASEEKEKIISAIKAGLEKYNEIINNIYILEQKYVK